MKVLRPIITVLGVKMRNPVDINGKWIGWTKEEVKKHLESVSNKKTNNLIVVHP
jgi:hypothetical protein